MEKDIDIVPAPLVPASRWQEFMEWANDGGYDESWHNRWDSKSHELQRTFLEAALSHAPTKTDKLVGDE